MFATEHMDPADRSGQVHISDAIANSVAWPSEIHPASYDDPTSPYASEQPPPQVKGEKRRQSLSAAWEARIQELKDYRAIHGHVKVPKKSPQYRSLAYWCNNVRRQRKLWLEGKPSSMTEEREKTLNDLGFWWGFFRGLRVPTFEQRVEELRQYKMEYNTTVMHDDGTAERKSLKEWLVTQKMRQREGILAPDREEILRGLGVQFEKRCNRVKWEEYYQQLIDYKEKHGDCNVTVSSGGEYKNLLTWVERQRTDYNRRQKQGATTSSAYVMSDERVELLSKIGFSFVKWDIMYNRLIEYKEKHGKFPKGNQRCKKTDPDKDLNAWMFTQRANFKMWRDGTLVNPELMTHDRLAKLLKINFPFEPLTNFDHNSWTAKFGELQAFKRHYGNCHVPAQFGMNRALSKWVKQQRVAYSLLQEGKPSDMTDEQVEMLRRIGFSFKIETATWDNMLDNLREYKKKHHTTLVDKKIDRKLAKWVKTQRQNFMLKYEQNDTTTDLDDDREEELENLSFQWISFEDGLKRLAKFKKDNDGSMDVPVPRAEEKKEYLAHWAVIQRKEYEAYQKSRPSQLSDNQVKKLQKIGFIKEQSTKKKRKRDQLQEDQEKTNIFDTNEKIDEEDSMESFGKESEAPDICSKKPKQNEGDSPNTDAKESDTMKQSETNFPDQKLEDNKEATISTNNNDGDSENDFV